MFNIGVHWSWIFEMILSLLLIGAHQNPLELKVLDDPWLIPLDLMKFLELVFVVTKTDVHYINLYA
jgi:hypothetical protein